LQQDRLKQFKATLAAKKQNLTPEEEARRKKEEEEILKLIIEDEERQRKLEATQHLSQVKYFLDDLRETTLKELDDGTPKNVEAMEAKLRQADTLFGSTPAAAAEQAFESRWESALDKLLNLMDNPAALTKLNELINPNIAPSNSGRNVTYYEQVKQDDQWGKAQREARENELRALRKNNL
jgi:hypothetical protein